MYSTIHLVNLNSIEIVLRVGAARFAHGTFSDCGDGLSDRIGYATKDLDMCQKPGFEQRAAFELTALVIIVVRTGYGSAQVYIAVDTDAILGLAA